MIELDTIYNEDCLIGMKEIPDKSIDMILTDPPYGTTRNKWDVHIDLDAMWLEFNRVIKDHGAMCVTCQQPFETDLINANRRYFRYEWVWDKRCASGFLNANRMPLRRHENVAVFYKHLPTYNPQFGKGEPYTRPRNGATSNYGVFERFTGDYDGRRYPTDIVSVINKQGFLGRGGVKQTHPTEKPIELFEYFIKTYTNVGDVVLDAFSGSGTTAAAAKRLGRRYICFETGAEYYRRSVERAAKAE